MALGGYIRVRVRVRARARMRVRIRIGVWDSVRSGAARLESGATKRAVWSGLPKSLPQTVCDR